MALIYYPAILEASADGGFGVVFPDLPGCISAGPDAQSAAVNAAEALALHIEGMVADGAPLPAPSAPDAPLPDWLAEAEREGARFVARILVPADLPGRTVRPSITMDEALLARLDAAAAREGFTRSGYIAQAVRERLRRQRATL